MLTTSVIIASSRSAGQHLHDWNARFLCEEVRSRSSEMVLVGDRIINFADVMATLGDVPLADPCALILVDPFDRMDNTARDALESRANLVVLRVAIEDEVIQISARDPRLKQLVDSIQRLVNRGEESAAARNYELGCRDPRHRRVLEALSEVRRTPPIDGVFERATLH